MRFMIAFELLTHFYFNVSWETRLKR